MAEGNSHRPYRMPIDVRTGLVGRPTAHKIDSLSVALQITFQEHYTMSGPIVRSGPSPEFSKNWDSVFGKKQGAKSAAQPAKKAAPKKKKKAGK
jgi:hypothetical protein